MENIFEVKKKNFILYMFFLGFINVFGMQIRVLRFVVDVFIFNFKMIFFVFSQFDEIYIELMYVFKNYGVVLNKVFFNVGSYKRRIECYKYLLFCIWFLFWYSCEVFFYMYYL